MAVVKSIKALAAPPFEYKCIFLKGQTVFFLGLDKLKFLPVSTCMLCSEYNSESKTYALWCTTCMLCSRGTCTLHFLI